MRKNLCALIYSFFPILVLHIRNFTCCVQFSLKHRKIVGKGQLEWRKEKGNESIESIIKSRAHGRKAELEKL